VLYAVLCPRDRISFLYLSHIINLPKEQSIVVTALASWKIPRPEVIEQNMSD
jgi:hypothetical protein